MSKTTKQLPHERRKGEAALSEFAEFVEKQQALRYPSSKGASDADVHHEELDILDSLNLEDSEPQVPLRELFLADDDESLDKLVAAVDERLSEGHGEAVFDIGFENSGDSMHLTKPEWEKALTRLKEAAKKLHADCDVLLTKNIGGEVEAESVVSGKDKDKDCSGKVLIRQAPEATENVIETRIAVVGNGKFTCRLRSGPCRSGLMSTQSMPGKAPCLASSSRAILMTDVERLVSTCSDTNMRLRPVVPALWAWRSWVLIPRAT